MKSNKTRELIISGLLVALSIILPMFMPKWQIPPFTMTLAAHVPVIIAMFISPLAVVLTAIGNGLGFLSLGPVVVVRALTHIIFGLIGYRMIRKNTNYFVMIFLTMLVHAFSEFAVIFAFSTTLLANVESIWATAQITLYGTMIHHLLDFAIATPILIALYRSKYITYKIIRRKS